MARRAEQARARADRHLSGLLDRRQLLHLDRPRRRPAGLEPAGRRPRGARRRRATSTPAALRAGARGGADRRGQRLVLVVRRRPLVGPRPRVRRPVPPAPAERLPAAAEAGARRAVRQQHLGGRAAAAQTSSRRRSCRRRSTAKRRATSSGSAPACSRSGRSPARCTRSTARPTLLTRVRFGFDRERLFVRLDGDRPMARRCWPRATTSR